MDFSIFRQLAGIYTCTHTHADVASFEISLAPTPLPVSALAILRCFQGTLLAPT